MFSPYKNTGHQPLPASDCSKSVCLTLCKHQSMIFVMRTSNSGSLRGKSVRHCLPRYWPEITYLLSWNSYLPPKTFQLDRFLYPSLLLSDEFSSFCYTPHSPSLSSLSFNAPSSGMSIDIWLWLPLTFQLIKGCPFLSMVANASSLLTQILRQEDCLNV